MSSFSFFLNGVEVCEYGFESARLSLRVGGPDALDIVHFSGSETPIFTRNQIVPLVVKTFDDEGEIVTSSEWFQGRVTVVDEIEGSLPGFSYRLESPWHDLALCPLEQTKTSWNAATSSAEPVTVPHVILGVSGSGNPETTGATISRLISLAASRGANVTTGTILTGFQAPPTELENQNCDQGLRQYLRHHPDAQAYFVGNQFNVQLAASLPVTTLDACADGFEIQSKRRDDLAPVGFVIHWKITRSLNGQTRVVWETDSAGNTSGWPPPLSVVIPLRGADVTTQVSDVETRTLPSAGNLDSDLAKNYFKGLFPALQAASNADLKISDFELEFVDPKTDGINAGGDATVNPNSKPFSAPSSVADFPRHLTSGQVTEWMSPLGQHDALLSCRITYSGTNAKVKKAVGSGVEISETITITNALSRRYEEVSNIDYGEAPIEGLAAQYWNAIKTPQYEGEITGAIIEKALTLKPGNKVIESALIPLASVIQSASFNLIQNTFKAGFGPVQFRSPADIVAMRSSLKANSPKWTKPEEITQAEAGAGTRPIPVGGGSGKAYGNLAQPKAAAAWDLVQVPAASGPPQWKVEVGEILDGSGKAGAYLTCTNPDETFIPEVGGHIVMEFAEKEPTEYKIQYYGSWPITDGYLVEVDSEFGFLRSLVPLYEVVAQEVYGATRIADGVFAQPVSFRLVHSFFQQADDARIIAPDIVR